MDGVETTGLDLIKVLPPLGAARGRVTAGNTILPGFGTRYSAFPDFRVQ